MSRLRRSTFCSNACKFTSTGGHIRIVTKLIYPVIQLPAPPAPALSPVTHTLSDTSSDEHPVDKAVVPNDGVKPAALSTTHLSKHDSIEAMKKLNRIAVRIEVHDTGVGIRAGDLVDNKLFR